MTKRITIASVLLFICIVATIYAADYDKQTIALLANISAIFSGVLYRDAHYQ